MGFLLGHRSPATPRGSTSIHAVFAVTPWGLTAPEPELALVLGAGLLVLAAVALDRVHARGRTATRPPHVDDDVLRIWSENTREVVFRVSLTDPPRVVSIGPGCEEVLGFTAEEFRADSALARRLALPESIRGASAEVDRGTQTVVGRWAHGRGRSAWIERRQRIVLDDEGRPIAIEGAVRDVTTAERSRRNVMMALDVEAGSRRVAQRAAAHARHLKDTILILAHAADEPSVHEGILQSALAADQATTCTVWRVDSLRHNLVAIASSGDGPRTRIGWTIPLTVDSGPTRVVTTGEPCWIGNLAWTEASRKPRLPDTDGLAAWACVPLHVDGEIRYAISVGYAQSRIFDGDDRSFLLTLASHAETTLERVRLIDEVSSSWKALQALSRRLLEAQENERRRVARELHDVFGAALSGIRYNLHALSDDAAADRPCPAHHLDESVELIDRLAKQIRTLSIELRPGLLDERGLAEAVRWYGRRFGERLHIPVHIHDRLGAERLDPTIETAAFRILQEVLRNVERHAQACSVTISITRQGDRITLLVADDGVGFDPSRAMARARLGESLGLLSIRERAELLGGNVEIDSSADHPGTHVYVRLPADPPRVARRTAQA